MQIPMEIYDHIIYHVWNVYNDFLYLTDDARHYSISRCESRRDLAALRLVNKAFCCSASSWLFRHINARSSSYPSIPPLERLMKLSRSSYAVHVCQIDFGFREAGKPTNALYIEDLVGILSSCLVRFPNLRALEFHEPPSSLSQDQRKAYMDTVVSTLRYVPLPKLTELEVSFPITHDFGRFFPNQTSSLQIPIRDITQRLRHLGLYVCAYTDSLDQRHRRSPVLPEYAALPNRTHATQLFKMIEIAPNLESLALHSVNILDIDSLAFPRSLCLRSLYLGGVSISSHVLLSLVNQSLENLRYINFSLVQLKSGTWQQVLLQMCKLPHLLDINIDHSGYSLTGSSSDLADRLLPDPEWPQNIETMNDLDVPALGNLQRHVNANRIAAGFRPFPDSDYRRINKPSVESITQSFPQLLNPSDYPSPEA